MLCKDCGLEFEIGEKDRYFCEKLDVPEPESCGECRVQSILAWRRELPLYRAKCEKSGKTVVGFYPSDSEYRVYAQDVWWSDEWNAFDYGRDFDFSRGFFEQFDELMHEVPHMGIMISHGENSDYCPHATNYKNSYYCVSGRGGEDLSYCYLVNNSRDCVDCYACTDSERCYECIQGVNLYNCIYCKECKNSNDLYFCSNCEGCSDCIGCYGLKRKKYHILNKPYSKEDYERIRGEILDGYAAIENTRKQSEEFHRSFPIRALQMIGSEGCSGDFLLNSKNSSHCFQSEDLEDCYYVWNTPKSKDSAFNVHSSQSELIYNSLSNVGSYNCIANVTCWDVKNTAYCFQSFYSNDLFGCVGLKRKKFCILNKQYSEEEYVALRARIIEHMSKTGEWGKFFPRNMSPYFYNQTAAQQWFPLERSEVEAKGWKWSDFSPEIPQIEKSVQANQLPDKIADVPEEISSWAIYCEATGKPFRIAANELRFYRKLGLPIPRRSPDQRHVDRAGRVNGRKLVKRNCSECASEVESTILEDAIVCEECYLKIGA